jgi:hypothetical protein
MNSFSVFFVCNVCLFCMQYILSVLHLYITYMLNAWVYRFGDDIRERCYYKCVDSPKIGTHLNSRPVRGTA